MSRVGWSVIVAVIVATCGCEARVALGSTCSTPTDCATGLVCSAGRCRSACAELRECPAPAVCVLDEDGRGACSVAEDLTCGGGCLEPLVCDDGHCVQRCDDASDCAAGLGCVQGSCARTSVGACDLLSGEGCEAGRRCELLPDDTLGCVAVTVARDQMLGLHEACDEGETCEDGLRCVAGRCIRYCLRDAEADRAITSCGLGSDCFQFDEVGEPAPTPEIGYCSEPCDPVDDDTCLVGHRCAIVFSEPLYQSSCRVDDVRCDGTLGEEGCELGPAQLPGCARGLVNVQHLFGRWTAGMLDRVCARPCDETTDCEGGFTCWRGTNLDIEDLDGRARRIGLCLPTCDAGTCTADVTALGLACESSGRYCTTPCADDTECHPSMHCTDDRCTPDSDS